MSGRVVMSDQFGRSYSDLDGSIKNRVLDFVVKLQERPDIPGLDLKTPEGVSDHRIKTARVSDFWRAVLIELPDSQGYVLVAVKPHDDAYSYAERLRFGVNEVTGALEVIDEAALYQAVESASPSQSDDTAATPVLGQLRAKDLRPFGVAENIADQLVAVTDENQLLAIAQELPALQANAVLDLAEGRDPSQVWADLVAEEEAEIDTSDVLQALGRPMSRLTFTDGRDTEELRAVLEEDFRAWRVWLHPLQRKLAYHNGWRGPYRVTGGAGTGKTVTAIHRARHLADRLEQQGSDAKVLFTTFTKNLAQNIESQLQELAGTDITKRVEIRHIDSLAHRVLTAGDESGTRLKLRSDDADEIRTAWDSARQAATGQWDPVFLQAEWNQVILAQGIEDRAEYLRASRSGRGRRVSRPQRDDLWTVFERFAQILNAHGVMTYTQAASRAATRAGAAQSDGAAVTDSGTHRAGPQYQHAVVDEAQDLHPAHWRLVRAVTEPGNDDLFIVGDAHQRIYGKPVVLSRYGIETRGRSRRLTVNYRTSRQILNWSMRVAYGYPVDDLEGEGESLDGARSEFDGPEPEAQGFRSVSAERRALVEKLSSWHDSGLRWADIAVVARTHAQVGELVDELTDADIPVAKVGNTTDENTLGDYVRAMTMHRAKGLEYRAIALVNASNKELPPRFVRELDADEQEAAYARERNLVYVAGSRACEQLYVSWAGEPSELLAMATSAAPS